MSPVIRLRANGLARAISRGVLVVLRMTLAAGCVGSGWAVAQDTIPPTAPTNVTATTVSDKKITVSWSPSTDNVGVTNYRVYRCEGAGCTNFVAISDPSASQTTVSSTTLQPSTSYSYKVRARDAALNYSNDSNVASATTLPPDTLAPTTPQGLTVTNVTATQIHLAWTASTDNYEVTKYFIERCEGAECSNFVQVTYTNGWTTAFSYSLTPGTPYSFRVRASDGAGNLSNYSAISSATTGVPPTAPTALTATAISDKKITLSWNAATDDVGVTAYRIYRCQGEGCANFSAYFDYSGGEPTTTTVTNHQPETSYSYYIKARDEQLNYSDASNVATATTLPTDTSGPTTPTGLMATLVSANRIDLAWNPSTDNYGVSSYRVERATCNSDWSSCTTFGAHPATTSASYSDILALSSSTSYRYRVRAEDGHGNVSAYSEVLDVRTLAPDTTPPTAPSGLSAVAASASQIDLSWTAATDDVGVVAYRVEQCQGAGCSNFVQVATPIGTTHSSTGLAAATSYSFRVRAADAAGNLSEYSAVASATTSPLVQTNLYFVHADHLNTPRLVADSTGTTVWRWDQQEPFGSNPANDDPDGNSVAFDLPLRLPGQRYDAETGLHYNYYRDYDPSIGRYGQSDPVGLFAGVNTYAYVLGRPVLLLDQFGLDATVWRNPATGGPSNGNWGGKCWGGGQYSCGDDGSGDAPPTDSADACYMRHDKCWDRCRGEPLCKLLCDQTLVEELKALPSDSRKWPQPPRTGTEGDSERFMKGGVIFFLPPDPIDSTAP